MPKYQDGDESDTFVLSGAEDLVPVFGGERHASGREKYATVELPGGASYAVHRYRPRTESIVLRASNAGLIARTGDAHWESISKDNVKSVYGKSAHARASRTRPIHIASVHLAARRNARRAKATSSPMNTNKKIKTALTDALRSGKDSARPHAKLCSTVI
ncbi:MAG: SpvB/TcaC N-terminal domain-containing protein [Pyrinomonadaceae bacterium]